MAEDTLHGDPELDALAEREQTQVIETVKALRARGYDYVVVQIAKVIPGRGGDNAVPGASAIEASDRVLPCLPRQADNLRAIARQLDEAFEKRGTSEAEEGYLEDLTHRAKEFGA